MTGLTIIIQGGQLLADSREIAKMTGKRHDHLLRDIDGYVEALKKSIDPKIGVNDFFHEKTYQDSIGRSLRKYDCTKKGCDMIANKMTGEKGILFTATYVTRFEEMEKQINSTEPTPSYMIDDRIKRAERWIEEQHKVVLLEQKAAELENKAKYVDIILQSKSTVTTSQIAKDYGLSGRELNEILKEEKIQYKQNGQWLLYSSHANKGYTMSHTIDIVRSNGEKDVKMNTRWTQRGRLFIHEVLNKRGIKANVDKDYFDVR